MTTVSRILGILKDRVISNTYKQSVRDLGDISGNTTLGVNDYGTFTATLTDNVTFDIEDIDENAQGDSFTILVTQDDAQQYSITYPNEVEWDNGSAPSDPATGAELEITFITYDEG